MLAEAAHARAQRENSSGLYQDQFSGANEVNHGYLFVHNAL
jgi:hypothetical protein